MPICLGSVLAKNCKSDESILKVVVASTVKFFVDFVDVGFGKILDVISVWAIYPVKHA
jgi:hypothetical protein